MMLASEGEWWEESRQSEDSCFTMYLFIPLEFCAICTYYLFKKLFKSILKYSKLKRHEKLDTILVLKKLKMSERIN